jgi:hypothetical protein
MVKEFKQVEKSLKGWKTIGFNLGAMSPFLVEFGAYLLGYSGFENLVPAEYLSEYALGMGVVNLVLRYMTSTPVGQKY